MPPLATARRLPLGIAAKGKEGTVPKAAKSLARLGAAETWLKLRFSCYLPVAWLKIPGLHHHREVFPLTTVASASARFRQIAPGGAASSAGVAGGAAVVEGGVGVGVGCGGAVLPTASPTQSASTSSAGNAGGLTEAMKLSVPRSARMAPVQVEEVRVVEPGPGGAGPRMMTVRRRPALSWPLTCASATSPSLAPGSPRVFGLHPIDMSPGRSAAASVLSCVRGAGWTVPRCAQRAAIDADVPRMAAALAAGVLVLFVSVAIPLMHENEPVSPPAARAS
jgi:hypothetical protein